MTYGVRPKTMGVYLEMVPSLTEEQKRQIRAWLTEAREHASCTPVTAAHGIQHPRSAECAQGAE